MKKRFLLGSRDIIDKKWELINFCEFDKYAVKSYCAIHNEPYEKNLGDINLVDENNLEKFTMICGGSPCQDLSVAGKQKGTIWTCNDCDYEYNPIMAHYDERDKCPKCGSTNINKTRSSLLIEFLRIVRANNPNFGIYENVKNIVGKKFESTFKAFTDELKDYGYNVYYKVLNAKNYGVPQNRERVYVVFIKNELDNGLFKFPEPFDNGLRLKDVLENDVDEKYYIRNDKAKKLIMELIASGEIARQTDRQTDRQTSSVISPLNPMPDDTCRTIKNQYQKNSIQNFESKGTFGATGVMEIKPTRRFQFPADGTLNAPKAKDFSNCVLAKDRGIQDVYKNFNNVVIEMREKE